MPRTTHGAYQCPRCDASPFRTPQALGAHTRYLHGAGWRKAPEVTSEPKGKSSHGPIVKKPDGTMVERITSPREQGQPQRVSGDGGHVLGVKESTFLPAPPVPIPCARCFVRMPEVQKALAIVLIRAGMSIERAQKTVKEMEPILRKHPEVLSFGKTSP